MWGLALSSPWRESCSLQAEAAFHLVSLRDGLYNDSTCRVYESTLKRLMYYDQRQFDPVWIAENEACSSQSSVRTEPPCNPSS